MMSIRATFARCGALLVVALFGLSSGALRAAPVLDAPLPVNVAVGAKQFLQFQWLAVSPDGRYTAIVLQNGTKITESLNGTGRYLNSGATHYYQGCEVWIVDLRTGKSTNITDGFGTSYYPVWSGNGKYLAFLSDRGGTMHVWIWDRASGTTRKVSSAIVHDASSSAIHWVDGDREILTTLLPDGTSVADADAFSEGYVVQHNGHLELSHSTVREYSNNPAAPNNAATLSHIQGYDGSSNGDPFDYGLLSIADGSVKKIFRNVAVDEMSISDDQRYAVLKHLTGAASDAPDQGLYELSVVTLTDGKTLFALHDLPMAGGWTPTWRPGTDSFVYTTGSRGKEEATKKYDNLGQSFLVSISDRSTRKITTGDHPGFGQYDQSAGWSPDGKYLYYVADQKIWTADVDAGTVTSFQGKLPISIRAFVTIHDDRLFQRGNTIYVLTSDPENKQEGFAAIDTTSGAIVAQGLGDRHIASMSDALIAGSPAQNSIYYVAEDATHPWDVWSTDPTFSQVRQLTHLNPQLERYKYGQPRLIDWTTPDGTRYQGAVILPSNYIPGHRYPTIIYQYPGDDKSDNLNKFGGEGVIWGNFQLYATRGYVVVMPNMILKNPSEQDITNGKALVWLNALLDTLVASGISEPSHFGLEGASNGGYSSLAFATQTDRLSAIIDDSGLPSWITLYTEFSRNGNGFYVNQQERSSGGTPWNKFDEYISMSPFFKFDRVTTPIMIVQGTAAENVQQKEGDETYVALRRLDKEVTYLLYEGDGHTRSSFTYPHEIDYWNRAIDWYDRHLKP